MLADTDVEHHYNPTVRLLDLERPSGSCGFHLTRSKWDPYPWISRIDPGSPADSAGLKTGDCLLEVNGEDVVGKRISDVAQLVKTNSNLSLLVWNAGIDSQCSPEALCCGPMPTNLQRLSACMSSILAFLECPVCLDTIVTPTYQCDNGHLICMRCRTKSERCPVCRIRFTRGRSLLADQIYNALTEAFELREDSHELRSVKMQQIFKLRKTKNVPNIKVTQAHTNKFLARLIGKSSSVDNLSSKNESCHLAVDGEFNAGLKMKSLSSSEIFNPASPSISRTGSINGLNRASKYQIRSTSHHGSFESLEPVPNHVNFGHGVLYHCPYKTDCSTLIKGCDVIQHFQIYHDGPLIQYFKPKIRLPLQHFQDHDSYVLNFEDNLFFLKSINENSKASIERKYKDIRIWAWLLGTKKQSTDFQLHIHLFNKNNELNTLLSVRSAVYSLSSVSWTDIKESRKGVYISSDTLNAICTHNTFIEMEIFRCNDIV